MSHRPLSLWLLIASCAGDVTAPPSAECRDIADCEKGSVCYNGACRQLCISGADCPEGEGCSFGICGECSAPEHCAGSFACLDGECLTSCAGNADCSDGTFCNGAGACEEVLPIGDICDADDSCDSGNCLEQQCCPAGCAFSCDGEQCTSPLGQGCSSGVECESGFCADGVCCDSACDGECRSCSSAGACTPILFAEEPLCRITEKGARMCDGAGACQAPHQLVDANDGGGPSEMVELADGSIVFAANQTGAGRELWIYDDAGGARLLEDIWPGLTSSTPTFVAVSDDKTRAFYRANDGLHGTELWVTDGTAFGTRMLADINPRGSTSFWSTWVVTPTYVYFVADDSFLGIELWRTDGTTAGTVMVGDMTPGAADTEPTELAAVGEEVLFAPKAYDGELWRWDGVTFGQVCAGQFTLFPFGSISLEQMAALGGFMYIGTEANGLWRYDPSTDTCAMQYDPGGTLTNVRDLKVLGDSVYFTAGESGIGTELFKFRPGTGGARLVDLNGTSSGSPDIDFFMGGDLYFRATGVGTGKQLYRFDFSGTLTGTATLLTNLTEFSISPKLATASYFYFTAHDFSNGSELRRTNGTTVDTLDAWPGVGSASAVVLGAVQGGVLVSLSLPDDGHEVGLWSESDGSFTSLDMRAGVGSASVKAAITTGAGDVVFGAATASDGLFRLMRVPAGSAAPQALDTLDRGDASGVATDLVIAGGKIFFGASDPVHGTELWVTDGTPAGTHMVKDVNPGAGSSVGLPQLQVFGNVVLVFLDDGVNGRELWRSDGTEAGTYILKDIFVGEEASATFDEPFGILDGLAVFTAEDETFGEEPWVTDGTPSGTIRLADCNTSGDGRPENFERAGDWIYFQVNATGFGTELWKTDGTPGGTSIVKNIRSGTSSSTPKPIMALGDEVLFFATGDDGIRKLWRSDGSDAGTVMIADLWANIPTHQVNDFLSTGDAVWISVPDDVYGRELWRTEGTTESTILVDDLEPGAGDSSPDVLTAMGSSLYFVAATSEVGRELFVTTGAGATLVADLGERDTDGAALVPMATFAGRLFFGAVEEGDTVLWSTAGGASSTFPVCAAPRCLQPSRITTLGPRLFMRADVGFGQELVVFP